MSITDQIQKVRAEFNSDFARLSSENSALDQIRIKYLGRNGLVASLFVQMGTVLSALDLTGFFDCQVLFESTGTKRIAVPTKSVR